MSDVAIQINNLSKLYRIGAQQQKYATVRDKLIDLALAPVRRLQSRLNHNSDTSPSTETIWALKHVSFDVGRGEVVGVIGRNGAGKSTLLKILSRITEPTEGVVDIHGRVGSLLEVGTGFHPELTGRDNIFLNGAILGMKRYEIGRKFDEIVAFAEVEKFIDTPVKRYSSGMYLRLAFAVAAHLEPDILLVDEVLAVGDAAFQKKCLGKLGEVAQAGRTVLFVSHNLAAIGALTRLCVHLEEGKVVQVGETANVIEKYLTSVSPVGGEAGLMHLMHLPRAKNIINPWVQFEWVRTLDKNGHQADAFAEGKPIVIEIGFRVNRDATDMQFGAGIRALQMGLELFMVPSRIYHETFIPGLYTIRMDMDPNRLREGVYSIELKMFASGRRQDTLAETLRFFITRHKSYEEEDSSYAKWMSAGPIKLEYAWNTIERSS